MLVQFERTGGFAGMRTVLTIDSDSLPQEEAQQLSDLVNAARFLELPPETPAPSQGADQFLYTLTIESEGRRHTLHTSDAAATPSLQALIQWLTNAARKTRRNTTLT